jgi:hypothetical protein
MFIYPIYNYNWRDISTVYTYKKTSISPSNKIHREVGRAKDLSAPYIYEDLSGLMELTEHLAQALRSLNRIREMPDLNPGLDIVSFGLHVKHFSHFLKENSRKSACD